MLALSVTSAPQMQPKKAEMWNSSSFYIQNKCFSLLSGSFSAQMEPDSCDNQIIKVHWRVFRDAAAGRQISASLPVLSWSCPGSVLVLSQFYSSPILFLVPSSSCPASFLILFLSSSCLASILVLVLYSSCPVLPCFCLSPVLVISSSSLASILALSWSSSGFYPGSIMNLVLSLSRPGSILVPFSSSPGSILVPVISSSCPVLLLTWL